MKLRCLLAVLSCYLLILAPVVRADSALLGWRSVAPAGFGDAGNLAATALCSFGGRLYAGTLHPLGSQVWRWHVLDDWVQSSSAGFNDADNTSISSLAEYGGQLYAGTENAAKGAEIWRTQDGQSWWRVMQHGFNDRDNSSVSRFAVYNGSLYAATSTYSVDHGCEIWRSLTGSQDRWQPAVSNGFDDVHNASVLSFELFKGYLYAGTWSLVQDVPGVTSTGGEVWRTADGMIWRQVNVDGFGSALNQGISALATYDVYLYASTLGGEGHGAEVWRCRECDGSDWLRVVFDGFGNSNLIGPTALEVHDDWLYLAVGSRLDGMEAWRTNGETWQRIGWGGLGHPGNQGPVADGAMAVFGRHLYVGMLNPNGAEVWGYAPGVAVLPLVFK